ncbi:MAG: RDD family protein [Calditrichaeota bacterium]|nr:MAG: RDD family protein [Calditrichota bacterium]
MEHLQIQTAQHVPIEYEIASIGDRILAALIDYGILISYIIGGFIFLESTRQLSGMVVLLFLLLPYALYDLLCELFLDGQSIGKRVMKIKVVKLDGSQPGLGDYLLRWLLRAVDITLTYGGLAMVSILAGGKGQRLGDIAAGTTVIKLKQRVTLEETVLTEVEAQYQPRFPRVRALTGRDIETVKEVLQLQNHRLDAKLRRTLLRKTRLALEKKMGLTADMPDRDFLETVVKDYNMVQGQQA